MRTNIVIEPKLMSQAMRASGARTKREAVEAGLRLLVEMKRHRDILELRGTVQWDGDLDDMRTNDLIPTE